ncbi:hypothetical protein KEM52_002675, partial [Ascosphaera acerosa]
VVRASSALLSHIKQQVKQQQQQSEKKNLLADDDDDEEDDDPVVDDTPVWLVITTKKHIVEKERARRLKPGKIALPHSLNDREALRVCLLTADPQRAVKDVVADTAAFPATLRARITRVLGFSKLKARYTTFEARRQLLAEHDVFLADDRIVNRLPGVLGKVFYKGTKRPIPINIAAIQKSKDGKRLKKDDPERKRPVTSDGERAKYSAVAAPAVVAREIERALAATPVQLAPAASAMVRVARATFTPQQVAANVDAVVAALTARFIAGGWRNVKALHIKTPTSMAVPLWMASELWLDDADVVEKKLLEDGRGQDGLPPVPKKEARDKKRKLLTKGDALAVTGETEETKEETEQGQSSSSSPPPPPKKAKKAKTKQAKAATAEA